MMGIGEVSRTPVHIQPEMKMWLVSRNDADRDEWRAFVIRAETEQEARDIATAHGHYGRDSFTSPDRSTCIEIKIKGNPGIILGDFSG